MPFSPKPLPQCFYLCPQARVSNSFINTLFCLCINTYSQNTHEKVSFNKSIYNKFFIPFHLSIMSTFTVFSSSTSPISVPKPSSNQPKISTNPHIPTSTLHLSTNLFPLKSNFQSQLPHLVASNSAVPHWTTPPRAPHPRTRTDSPPVAADSRHCKVQNLVTDRAVEQFWLVVEATHLKNMLF